MLRIIPQKMRGSLKPPEPNAAAVVVTRVDEDSDGNLMDLHSHNSGPLLTAREGRGRD